MDQKILENRLISRESAINQTASITQTAMKLNAFFKAKFDNIDSVLPLDSLIRDILLHQIETSKSSHIIKNCDIEIKEYQLQESEIDSNIEKTKINILNLTEELAQQQQIRRHKEECETKAKGVNALPSRLVMGKDIDNMNNAIKKTEDQTNLTESRIQMRMKQFHLLVNSIVDLQRTLKEDDELNKLQAHLEANDEEEDEVEGDERDYERVHSRGGDEERTQVKKPRLDAGENETDHQVESDEARGHEAENLKKNQDGNDVPMEATTEAGEVSEQAGNTTENDREPGEC